MSSSSSPVRLVSSMDDARSRFDRFPAVEVTPLHDTLRGALDRRMVQWVLAYLAGAWLVLQMVDVLKDMWDWPLQMQRAICVALGLGLLPALVISWYHGERGTQRVTGTEVLLVGAIVFTSGATIWTLFAP